MSKTPQSAGINVPHIMTRWYCVEYRGRDGKGGKVKPPFPYHSPTVPSLLIGGSHLCTFSHCKILRRFADKISFSVFSSSHTTPGIQSCIPTSQTSHSLFPGFSPPPPHHLSLKQLRSPVILRTLSFPFVRTGQPEWLVCEWSAPF